MTDCTKAGRDQVGREFNGGDVDAVIFLRDKLLGVSFGRMKNGVGLTPFDFSVPSREPLQTVPGAFGCGAFEPVNLVDEGIGARGLFVGVLGKFYSCTI